MDLRFWSGNGGKPTFDENGFFNIPGRMEEDKTGQDLSFRAGKADESVPCVENLIDNLVRVPDTGIKLPDSPSVQNSSGFLSLPANGLSVARHSGFQRFEGDLGSSVGMPVPCSNGFSKMGFDHIGTTEGEIIKAGNNPKTYVEHNFCIPIVDQACSTGSDNVNLMVSCSNAPVNVNNVQSDNKHLPNGTSWGSYKEVMSALMSPFSSHALLYEKPQFQRPPKPKLKRKEVPGSNDNPILKKSAFKEPFDSFPTANNSASKEPFHSFPIMKNSTSIEPFGSFPIMKNSASEGPYDSFPIMKRSASREPLDSSIMKKSASKEPFDGFPSNVRSLMSTGIFNEALVRYVTPSQELPGIISTTGYLCGCESCNFSKAISASEFEVHAGHKTKHPNNHIRLENGRTMHEIVMELKLTSRSKLLEAIQTVTGCTINQDALNAWKESYKAELEACSV